MGLPSDLIDRLAAFADAEVEYLLVEASFERASMRVIQIGDDSDCNAFERRGVGLDAELLDRPLPLTGAEAERVLDFATGGAMLEDHTSDSGLQVVEPVAVGRERECLLALLRSEATAALVTTSYAGLHGASFHLVPPRR